MTRRGLWRRVAGVAATALAAACGDTDALIPGADAASGADSASVCPSTACDATSAPGAGQDAGADDTAEPAPDAAPEADTPGGSEDPADTTDAPDLSVAEDASAPAAGFAGHCPEAAPLEPTGGGWANPALALLTKAAGDPNHRIRDLVLNEGAVAGAKLRGRFTYGVIDKDLEGEDVELWIRRCPGWESLGVQTTDVDGVAWFELPELPRGDYAVQMVVRGDKTAATGHLAVWPKGMPAIITDVDGTLTTSDWQLFQDLLGGADAEEVPGGADVMHRWVQKGYRVVYLTGRPQVLNRYSNQWLQNHAFPEGVVHLTDDAEDVLPFDFGVREFKAGWLNELTGTYGVVWTAAYGNASTDIGAYADAAIAKDRTFIYGPNAGNDGTVALPGYTEHLPWVDAWPDAVVPP